MPQKRPGLSLHGHNTLALRQNLARFCLGALAVLAWLFIMPRNSGEPLPVSHIEFVPSIPQQDSSLTEAQTELLELENRLQVGKQPDIKAKRKATLLHSITDIERRLYQRASTPGFKAEKYEARLKVLRESYQNLERRTE